MGRCGREELTMEEIKQCFCYKGKIYFSTEEAEKAKRTDIETADRIISLLKEEKKKRQAAHESLQVSIPLRNIIDDDNHKSLLFSFFFKPLLKQNEIDVEGTVEALCAIMEFNDKPYFRASLSKLQFVPNQWLYLSYDYTSDYLDISIRTGEDKLLDKCDSLKSSLKSWPEDLRKRFLHDLQNSHM